MRALVLVISVISLGLALLWVSGVFAPGAETAARPPKTRVAETGRPVLPAPTESARGALPGERARVPVTEDREPTAESGCMTLTVGPRPAGVATTIGRLAQPPRLEEEERPDWYRQQAVLGVILAAREGARGSEAPSVDFDGSAENARSPMRMTWTGLSPGVYDLEFVLRGDAGAARTALAGIIVEAKGGSKDPRLAVWDPMKDFEVMELSFLLHREYTPDRFVIGVPEGDGGRAFACDPRTDSGDENPPSFGPFQVVRRSGEPLTVHAFAEWSGELAIAFVPGPVQVLLPPPIRVFVLAEIDESSDIPEESYLRVTRILSLGQWRPPVTPHWISTGALLTFPPGYGAIVCAPAEGTYRWVGMHVDYSSEPFILKREEGDSRVSLRLRAPR